MADRHLAWLAGIKGDPRERFLGELIERLPAEGRALDLGCGAGVPQTRKLAAHCTTVGIDISESQLRLARELVPQATFVKGDLLDLSFPERSFDAISAFYVISHVPREHHAQFLRRIATWLKPGGWFLASLGVSDWPDTFQTWLGVEMFFSSYGAATNRRLIAEAGLTIEQDEIVTMHEPEGEATFLWVLAQRPMGDVAAL